jgi:hypothetical protein
MQRSSIIELLIAMIIGALLAYWLLPNRIVEIPGVHETEYSWIRDTIQVKDTVYFETIQVQPGIISIRDTTYNDSIPIPIDLLAEYDRITDSLINNSTGRMKFYKQITATKDTIDITLESIRDSIIDLEIRLGAREILKNQIRTVYIPNETKEEWWIKPIIGAGGIIIGYGLGSIK